MNHFPHVTEKHFLYAGANGRIASGTVYLSEEHSSPQPVLFVCHGFKAFKDWGFFPYLGKFFASKGFYVVSFNFSHNGCDEKGREEADLLAFKENRFSFEETDLRCLCLELGEKKLPKASFADESNLHLLGHSRGGSTVIRCADMSGVRSLVLLASISRYPQVNEAEEQTWRKEGEFWIENQRTKTRLPLGVGLLEEMIHDRDLLETTLKQISLPVCIIHGSHDLTVPASAAAELSSWAEHSELHILEGAGHTFEMKHPCLELSPAFENLLQIVTSFLSVHSAQG